MYTTQAISRVKRLRRDSDFWVWEREMKALLMGEGLWRLVRLDGVPSNAPGPSTGDTVAAGTATIAGAAGGETPPALPSPQDSPDDDARAYALIYLHIDTLIYGPIIDDCKSAREAWAALQGLLRPLSEPPSRPSAQRTELPSLEMRPREPTTQSGSRTARLRAQEVLQAPKPVSWVVGTAPCHITRDCSLLHNLRPLPTPVDLTVVGGQQMQALATGMVKMQCTTSTGRTVTVTLHHVLYVPDARVNLLSVGAATTHGVSLQFANNKCCLSFGQDTVLEAPLEHLFVLSGMAYPAKPPADPAWAAISSRDARAPAPPLGSEPTALLVKFTSSEFAPRCDRRCRGPYAL